MNVFYLDFASFSNISDTIKKLKEVFKLQYMHTFVVLFDYFFIRIDLFLFEKLHSQ